jgi:pepF/M3 family oligoendopeptidase
MRWNLNDIYTSFDSPEFQGDVKLLGSLVAELNEWAAKGLAGDSAIVLADAIGKFGQYRLTLERAIVYCYLRLAVEAENGEAQAWVERLSALDADAVQATALFRQYLGSLGQGLDDVLLANSNLTEFAFYLRENQAHAKYMLSSEVEKALSIMEITGSSAWSNLQNTLTATLSTNMEADGKKLTLTMVRNLAYDDDAEVRRKAYEAELACYAAVEKGVAAALNGIKGESIAKCRMRGFASPLDQTLFLSRMDRQTLDTMIGTMEEYLPVFRQYLKAKAKLLGHQALPFYDLFAPVGNLNRRFTLEEARKYLVETFRGFSDKMADFMNEAFDREWLDTEPREGKQGGAFCSGVHAIGQPRILANFDGSFSAVSTLAHELGHGYHGLCLKDGNVLNADYPMPLAETASIFNETFLSGRALEGAKDDGERLALLEGQLMEDTQVVVDILSRYYFETEVFARRAEGVMNADDLKGIMLDAQRRAYGDGLDGGLLHPYMWICKGHYYMGINFYNFPYAFGLLFGLGVYGLYKEQGKAFLPLYDKLLASTGSNDIATVCAAVGIDVHDAAFWRKSLNVIKEKVEAFIILANRASI